MGLKEEIKSILSKNAITMTDVAKEVTNRRGRKFSLTNFSSKLKKGTLTYNELKLIGEIAGFDVEFIVKQ